jgi:hypothetical protein
MSNEILYDFDDVQSIKDECQRIRKLYKQGEREDAHIYADEFNRDFLDWLTETLKSCDFNDNKKKTVIECAEELLFLNEDTEELKYYAKASSGKSKDKSKSKSKTTGGDQELLVV